MLLSVQDLEVTFGRGLRAVHDLSFDVDRGEVVAVVGESGSGKTVTAMSILGLLPSARVTGRIEWKGEDLVAASSARRREVRGREIGVVFQDAQSALNPVLTIGSQLGEMARVHGGATRREAAARAVELLDLVGIPEAGRRARAHPHELSGGMCQRVMIAMAIACNPDLLIADEPTTALDVTVQAQVLEVLLRIKDEIDSAIVLITHDLGVVAGVADRVIVMYAGAAVETGDVNDVFGRARHPYTLGLLGSLPRLDADGADRLVAIAGTPPSLDALPSGCAFHPRCRFARVPGLCAEVVPPLHLVGSGQLAACHFAEALER